MATRDINALFRKLHSLKLASDTQQGQHYADVDSTARDEKTAREIDELIADLSAKTKEQEASLKKLKAKLSAPPNPRARTAAYKSASTTLPYTPPPSSPLDALLATASLHRTSTSLSRSLPLVAAAEHRTQDLIAQEESWLREAKELNVALTAHLADLEDERNELARGGSKLRRKKEDEMRAKAKEMTDEARMLLRSLREFIDSELEVMLQVEDAGGPVVGDELDKDVLKRLVETAEKKAGKKNQPTLEQMWGQGDDPETEDPTTQLKPLLEAIMNAASEGQKGGDAYVTLRKESAASRFLVRSGVARFHPRDARRIRLVDFGARLEDT